MAALRSIAFAAGEFVGAIGITALIVVGLLSVGG